MNAASAPRERRILVVEDEPDIAALLQLHLAELPAHVRCECDGRMGLQAAQQAGPWDLLVLDLRLPGLGGLDVCRQLRLEGACGAQGQPLPILMLTARSAELDRVLGLELGADDYLTKPFSVLELQARVRALWRRVDAARRTQPAPDAPTQLQAGRLVLNREQRRAWQGAAELTLTQREFDLLWCFASAPGRAYSRVELLQTVWGTGHEGYEHTVNTHINRLRNKLAGDYIHTVWGVGYRFEAPAA